MKRRIAAPLMIVVGVGLIAWSLCAHKPTPDSVLHELGGRS